MFVNQGTLGSPTAVGIKDPRRITVSAQAAPTVLTLASDQNPIEWQISVPANSTKSIWVADIHDRLACGDNLTAIVAGDSNSFVRIE